MLTNAAGTPATLLHYVMARQLKAVRGVVAPSARREAAYSDPSGERCDKELAVLRESKHQSRRHQDSHGGAKEAVESLGEDRAAIRLSDDKDRKKRPIGIIERKPERDEEGEDCRRKRLQGKNCSGENETIRSRCGAFHGVRRRRPETGTLQSRSARAKQRVSLR